MTNIFVIICKFREIRNFLYSGTKSLIIFRPIEVINTFEEASDLKLAVYKIGW
jgi:hypothetical protein